MNIIVSIHSDIPIYEQLKEQIKRLILHKKILENEQLPSVRTLSKELQIGIITVKRAYDDLVSEGFIFSKAAKGYYVSPMNKELYQNTYVKKIKLLIQEIVKLKEEVKLEDEVVENLWRNKGGNKE